MFHKLHMWKTLSESCMFKFIGLVVPPTVLLLSGNAANRKCICLK